MRPEKNKWLHNLTLSRDGNKCKISNPCPSISFEKIKECFYESFKDLVSMKQKATKMAVLIWRKDCFHFLANIIRMVLFSYL